MRDLRLSELARWCNGRVIGDDAIVRSIGNDTRGLEEGALYVALRGENHDGHDFCEAAMQRGAAALLVGHPVKLPLPQLVCADPLLALGDIARELAATRATRIIAITGSNGKTTTRSLLQAIFEQDRGAVWASPGNHNNEIGLPLALIAQPECAALAIYEMGAGAPDDIAYLARIARPSISTVTNVAPAHLERLGSMRGVAQAKAAIIDALPDDGIAVVNADDAWAPYFIERAGARRTLRYGLEASAEVRGRILAEDLQGTRLEISSPWGSAKLSLPMPGRHQVYNALAAASLALAAGATLTSVVRGLEQAAGVAGRQQLHALANDARLIDDSYNANPGSTDAAIALLAREAARRGREAWLILGDMRELGPGGASLHAEAGRNARAAGIHRLFSVGPLARHASHAFGVGGEHFPDQQALIDRVCAKPLPPGAFVLVKGSRGSHMEHVVAAVLEAFGREHHVA